MTENATQAELRQYVDRLLRLREERRGLNSDITDVMTEAKSRGFDAVGLREMVRLTEMDQQKRQEQDAIRALYGEQLGLL